MIEAGRRLGPYEIVSPVGAGGMGEVYKARDTRLDRTVAIKVLPAHLSSSPEVRQRFEREAKTISQLSHPHICALYDVGNQDGVEYLVMEYLEGETLAERLLKGALPTEQVLRFGIEIADALDKAHRQGIVHRDLKPGNVMLTKSGVKLLDFGLAKAVQPASSAAVPTSLPTEGPALTAEGMILGTFQYMAPEQLEGKAADARTDIFAFAAVLYEMATGKKAFSGTSQASLISAIMGSDPRPISALQPMSPPALDRVVKVCFAKDPEERWQSARDVALQLRDVTAVEGGVPAVRRAKPGRLLVAGSVLLGVAGLAVLLLLLKRPSVASEPVSFSVPLPPGGPYEASLSQTVFSVSPDGRSLVFVGRDASGQDVLWLRPMRAVSARSLPGTEGAAAPFWSPDSRWIGFFAGGNLKKIEAAGGPPLAVCDVAGVFQSGTWGKGEILFAQLIDTAIHRVSEAGGSPVPVLTADHNRREWSVCWPSFLPDSRHFLYVGRSLGAKQTYVRLGDLQTGKSTALLSDCSRAECAPTAPRTSTASSKSGFLLFVRDGNLLAQPFDSGGLRLAGEPRVAVPEVWQHAFTGVGGFSVSRTGLLAYRSAEGPAQISWLDRQGHVLGSEGAPGLYSNVRLSPDGGKIAMSVADNRTGTHSIWVADTGGIPTRLTLGEGDDWAPVWSPDGRKLVFSRGLLRAAPHLHEASLEGGETRVLTEPGAPDPKTGFVRGVHWVQDWSSSGRYIAYTEYSLEGRRDIWTLDLARQREKTAFLASPYDETEASFSPDGRWLAFASDESGGYEVYVAHFPGPGKKLRVSNAGGMHPRWRRDGGELFYVSNDNRMMSVPFHPGAGGEVGAPQSLFSLDAVGWRDYDVTADGKRFLIIVNLGGSRSGFITVSTNWFATMGGTQP